MTEPGKPFKTIEVIDSQTTQTCKVACMSCIRGHRTTSCGIPVCRTKVFWTVKRPGRPSNACTCRYGARGGCKCVVAQSACPHKSKGGKRSGQCRCDEQGRYCCVLEPDHWAALLAGQRPTVDFFPTTEDLDARQFASGPSADMPSRSMSTSSPRSPATTSTTSPRSSRKPNIHILPNSYSSFQSPRGGLIPRFGMMGVGAPQGSGPVPPPDVLVWEGETPEAPRTLFDPPAPLVPPSPFLDHGGSAPSLGTDYTDPGAASSSSSSSAMLGPTLDFAKLQNDYFHYQFPSAICQNCGVTGCTCKHCPPVFQNFGTTSWAQCCGRKHARNGVLPMPLPLAPLPTARTASGRGWAPRAPGTDDGDDQSLSLSHSAPIELDPTLLPPGDTFDLGGGGGGGSPMALDISEFLVADLDDDRGGGCCCARD